MKKPILVSIFAVVLVTAAFSQSVSFSADYVTTHFEGVSISPATGALRGTVRLIGESSASVEEKQIYGGLDGDKVVNKPAELLAMASVLGIQDVPKEVALQLYAEIYMEGAVDRFLGTQGSKTHEQVLARLNGKYGFTAAEINSAVRAVVNEAVDAENVKRQPTDPATITEIKRIVAIFFITPTRANFDVIEQKTRAYGLTGDGEKGRNANSVLTYAIENINVEFSRRVMNPSLLVTER